MRKKQGEETLRRKTDEYEGEMEYGERSKGEKVENRQNDLDKRRGGKSQRFYYAIPFVKCCFQNEVCEDPSEAWGFKVRETFTTTTICLV